MDCYDLISLLATKVSYEDFVEHFLIVDDKNNAHVQFNDILIKCPSSINGVKCSQNKKISCKQCWLNALFNFGFKSIEENKKDRKDNNEIIDISHKYSYGDMLNILNKDKEKSFYCNKSLYFIKNSELKYCKYPIESPTPLCKTVKNTEDILSNTYYLTNIKINQIVSEIKYGQVKDYLNDGFIVMYVCNQHIWTIWLDGYVIRYNSEDFDIDDPEHLKELGTDLLCMYGDEAQWFLIDDSNC